MSISLNPKLAEHDLLNLRPFADRLEAYMNVENDYVDGSLVVSLAAPFGFGKSTFIEMWKADLISRREAGEFSPMPISLNAWESDYCSDPLVAILSGLIDAVEQWKGSGKPEESKLKEAAKDIAWFAVGFANSFVAAATGLDAVAAGELTDKKKAERAKLIPDYIKFHRARTHSMEQLKNELGEAFGGENLKVIVFVDELDRCRPDYAVSYLETIKHVFNIKGIAFVLAVDYDQLATSTRALYGESLKFEDYFRKFSHRTVRMPEPDVNTFTTLISKYVQRYMVIEGKRISGLPHQGRAQQIASLAKSLKLNPRQLQESFRILGHVGEVSRNDRSEQLYWVLALGTIFVCMLRSGHHEIYEKIKLHTAPPSEVAAELMKLLGKNDAQIWIAVYLSGVWPIGLDPKEWIDDIRKVLGYEDNEVDELSQGRIREFISGWGFNIRTATRIHGIIDHIENLGQFEKEQV